MMALAALGPFCMVNDVVLKSVGEVTTALGGVAFVQALTEAASPQVVTNWVARGRFASSTFLVLTEALQARGLTAPPELWGIVDPDKSHHTAA